MTSASLKQPRQHGRNGAFNPKRDAEHTLCYAFDMAATLQHTGSLKALKTENARAIDCKRCIAVLHKHPQIHNQIAARWKTSSEAAQRILVGEAGDVSE